MSETPHVEFKRTFYQRREIMRLVQQRQKSESAALKKMADTATEHKRKLLELLSDWLLMVRGNTTRAEGEVFDIAGVSLDEWLTLQRATDQLAEELAQATHRDGAAAAAFRRAAPLGRVQILFTKSEGKEQMETAATAASDAKAAREAIQRRIQQNDILRQELGERFLRGCLERMELLCGTEALGRQASAILTSMSVDIENSWTKHADEECRALEQLAKLVNDLRTFYHRPSSMVPHDNRVEAEV